MRHVTERIQKGELAIGDRLPSERDLVLQLGVSRPLVREGYRILESLGIVEVRRGSGVYVADRRMLDERTHPIWHLPVSALDIVAFIDTITARAAELAATNATDAQLQRFEELYERQKTATASYDIQQLAQIDSDFHSLLAEASGNAIAIAFVDLARPILQRERNVVLGTSTNESLVEHGQILDALRDRDPVRARCASRHHLLRSLRIYRDLANHPPGGAVQSGDSIAP